MVREELITSAVSFLQDPSVISSPLDKRVAFLQSKNLTQEEIDLALAQADAPSSQSLPSSSNPPPPTQSYGYPNQQVIRQPNNNYGYGYGPNPWPYPEQQRPPGRDWRDYFILLTLTSTLSYSLYALSRRYILPLISPPTPPQLESDKAAIDASFARAFTLIEQLATDTADIKKREEERNNTIDKALEDVNAVVEELKEGERKREVESRMIADAVHGLRDLVPAALEGWKAQGDGRLEELGKEVAGLKRLIVTRVGGTNGTAPSTTSTTTANSGNGSNNTLQPPSSSKSTSPSRSGANNRTSSSTPPPPPSYNLAPGGSNSSERNPSQERRASTADVDAMGLGGKVAAGKASYEGSEMAEKLASAPKREGSFVRGSGGGGRASIPAWQMAAGAAGKGEGSGSGSGSGDGGS
ncbi:MAG: hypothetical protein Q9220_000200 [cf. Caloplaca sp. 1 TL-2023]